MGMLFSSTSATGVPAIFFRRGISPFLCQEDAPLFEMVRYIHLNPIRAKIVKEMVALDTYPFCGHSVLIGKVKNDWQDIEWL